MIEKATHVPIVVRDQDRALKFYTQVLGFEKRQDSQQPGRPRWLTVAPKRQEVEFILVNGEYTVDPRPPRDADSGGNHFVFRTNDCRRDFDILKSRGVNFKTPAHIESPRRRYRLLHRPRRQPPLATPACAEASIEAVGE